MFLQNLPSTGFVPIAQFSYMGGRAAYICKRKRVFFAVERHRTCVKYASTQDLRNFICFRVTFGPEIVVALYFTLK
jgi:hypothetical protein